MVDDVIYLGAPVAEVASLITVLPAARPLVRLWKNIQYLNHTVSKLQFVADTQATTISTNDQQENNSITNMTTTKQIKLPYPHSPSLDLVLWSAPRSHRG